MSIFFNKIWDTFTSSEQGMLLYFYPFKSTINFATPIIKKYFQALEENTSNSFMLSQYSGLIKKCINTGLLVQIEYFSNTFFLRAAPTLSFFLKSQATKKLGPKKLAQIELSFVDFYNWLSEQLYNMYAYTSPEERQINLDFLALEYDNLLMALDLSLKHQRHDFTDIYLMLNTYLFAIRNNHEKLKIGTKILNTLAPLQEKENSTNFQFSLADVHDSLGRTYLEIAQYQDAEYHFQEAFDKYHEFKLDKIYPEAAHTLYQNLAAVTSLQEKWEISNEYYSKSLAIAEQHDYGEGVANYYLNIGKNMLNLGQHTEAIEHFEKAVDYFHNLGIIDGEGIANNYLGLVNFGIKRFEAAEPYFKKALDIFNITKDQFRKAKVFNNYSLLYTQQHDFHKARSYAKKAISIFIESEDKIQEGISYINFCSAGLGLGELEQSTDYLRKALIIFLEYQDIEHLSMTLRLASVIDSYQESNIVSEFMDLVLEVYSEKEIETFLF